MSRLIFVIVLLAFLIFTNSGCAVVAGVAVYKVVKKVSTRAPKISEQERVSLECNEINGKYQDIFKIAKQVLIAWDYRILKEDEEKGTIIAENQEINIKADVTILTKQEGLVEVRISFKKDKKIVENERLYKNYFSSLRNKLISVQKRKG